MTDVEIIDGLFRREESALAKLQKTYCQYSGSIARRILDDPETAEEICSDVWMRIWQSIPPIRPDNLRLYIGRLTRNSALHRLEWESAAKRSGIHIQLDELSECLPDHFSGIDTDRLALQQTINIFLRSLPQEKRVVFIRRYWYGDSVEEIARRCGCKAVRITGILFRTRKELRRLLEKEGIEL